MRIYKRLLAGVSLLASARSCRAFVRVTAVSTRKGTAGRSPGVNMSSSWGGLFDAITGRAGGADATSKDGAVLTPKSRVKLGDLSVSPMGERSPEPVLPCSYIW